MRSLPNPPRGKGVRGTTGLGEGGLEVRVYRRPPRHRARNPQGTAETEAGKARQGAVGADDGVLHYMDFAATSALRPPEVVEAVAAFLRQVGATPGRGQHRLAREAERLALACRKAVVRILGVGGGPDRVVFCSNATQALNLALWGTLRPGDVVVTTPYEHNSVLRPIRKLARERGVEHRVIPGDEKGALDLEAAERLLEGARLLAVTGASNVLGTCPPLRELAGLARRAGALVLVDAAQWAGHFRGGLAEAQVDLVAFTGHKGLLGPQGLGGLWVRPGVEVEPWQVGGSGGSSLSPDMPPAFPDRLEAGSLNGPGMAGLLAGIEFLEREGVEPLHRRVMDLKRALWEGLGSVRGVRVLTPPAPDGVPIVTILAAGVPPEHLARRLDEDWGVLVRAGHHCAPLVHRLWGTEESGAVRFSLGWASTSEDLEVAVRGVEAIVRPTSVAFS